MKLKQQVRDYILKRLDKKTTIINSGCWLYDGYENYDGYRPFIIRAAPEPIKSYLEDKLGITYAMQAHKAAFLAHGGVLTKDKPLVLHSCFNKQCISPHHVYAGTSLENNNAADRPDHKGRKGSGHLSPKRLANVEQSFKNGLSTYAVAIKHRISSSSSLRIRNRLRKAGIC